MKTIVAAFSPELPHDLQQGLLHRKDLRVQVVRTLPERVQKLMGYEMGAYALGYVDDVRNPMSVLRDEAPPATTSFAPGR